MKITKSVVDREKYPHDVDDPKKTPRYVVWDDVIKGFGVRVYPSGRKTFTFRYEMNGRQRWMGLGDYGPMTVQQARLRAEKARVAVHDGRDPAEQRRLQRQAATTVADLAVNYIEEKMAASRAPAETRKIKSSTVKGYQQILDTHILPAFGKWQPAAVTEDDVERFHAKMHSTPYQANRCLHVMAALMKLAIRRGLRSGNPCADIKRNKEPERKRYLSAVELADLGDAIRKLEGHGVSQAAAAALRLLAFSGCRVNEILRLQWDDIDEERNVVHVRDAKGGPRTFPFTAPVADVLASLPRDSEWVIQGKRPGSHMGYLSRPWRRACEAAGIKGARLHDLRHSVGAWSASSGDSLLVVGALLGHRQAASTERYAHLADDAVHAAAERTASGIAAAMEGKGGDVIELRRK